MSLIAGAYSRLRNIPLPAGLERSIVRAISRRAGAPRQAWSNASAVLVQCETGAYDAPAFVRDGDAAVTALAGDPILRGRVQTPGRSRTTDVQELHDAFRAGELAPLGKSTGLFAGLHYDAADHALTLVSDKLGFRPLYYWMSDTLVVFASSLQAIKAIDAVPKRMDVRGVLQLAPLGYVVGNGTPYAGVQLLGPGEVMRFENGERSVRRYWRLDHVRRSTESADELADHAIAALRGAISRRLEADRTSVAFLTGGMDTRLVVCELLRIGVQLHTLNGSYAGNQDQLYARLFASAIGARHQEMPGLIGDRGYPDQMARRWYESVECADMPPERPRQIWTGIGGSVGLGGVAIDEPMLAALRAGATADAVRRFMDYDRVGLPYRVLTAHTRRRFAGVIEQSLLAEYESYEVDDAAKRPWLYTIFNEYRRAYMRTVEDIDLHECESVLPLCDPDVLAVLASVPTDWLLQHEFYMRLVARTDARFLATPWQTYPGHPPCPVPGPDGVRTQWDERHLEAQSAPRYQTLHRRVLRGIFSRDFPVALVGRGRVFSAACLMAFGLRDTRHVLQFVDTVHHFFRACGGRLMWALLGALNVAEQAALLEI